jgi:hypothetical protein
VYRDKVYNLINFSWFLKHHHLSRFNFIFSSSGQGIFSSLPDILRVIYRGPTTNH